MEGIKSIFPEIADGKKVHFVGVGGIGMSSLARWFLALNKAKGSFNKCPVSGSDLAKSAITQSLAKDGLDVKIGHKKGHINSGIGLIIRTKATKSDNPELLRAKELKIPTLTYSEAIGRLTERYKTIAVSGAHGKSTTTAFASLIIQKGGLDPTVIVGTNLREFDGKNFRAGRGPSTWFDTAHHKSLRASTSYLVLEADEFGRSFLDYSPTIAVITNIDLEHLDTYKNLADIKNAFLKFLSNTKNGGTFVLNKDNKILASLSAKINKIAKKKNCRILWYSIHGNTAKKIRKVIKIPGEHNISNAVAAYKVGRALGIPHGKILSAIGSYHGSWRRMEYRGSCYVSHVSCRVYDDYAHHPTEIKATLRAFKEKYKAPIVCVYQPHQAKRLQALFKDFENSFSDADILILIPMYQVVGRDSTNPRFTSKTLALAIARRLSQTSRRQTLKKIYYLANPRKIKTFLQKVIKNDLPSLRSSASGPRQSALVIMMGAGNIADYTKLLI